MSDFDSNEYHNPKRPRDPKAIRKISPLPEVTRKFCYRCWKAGDLCLCSQIVQVRNTLEIGIVFHPREYKNPINTGRLAFLSLVKAWCATGVELDDIQEYQKNLARFKPGEIGLMYPSDDAQDLAEAPADLKCLIVVDGTWNEAKKMIHRTPSMKSMPHFRFTPPSESNYRIRKEPAPHCVSTIESVVTALRAYDSGFEVSAPPALAISSSSEVKSTKNSVSIDISNQSRTPYFELLDIFDKMVDNQLECQRSKTLSRHKDRAQRREETFRTGALNWLHLSMNIKQRSFIEANMSEDEYLNQLEHFKSPEAVVEWIKARQQEQLKL